MVIYKTSLIMLVGMLILLGICSYDNITYSRIQTPWNFKWLLLGDYSGISAKLIDKTTVLEKRLVVHVGIKEMRSVFRTFASTCYRFATSDASTTHSGIHCFVPSPHKLVFRSTLSILILYTVSSIRLNKGTSFVSCDICYFKGIAPGMILQYG